MKRHFYRARYAGDEKRRGARIRGGIFHFCQRNALRAHEQFHIPPNRVIELGGQREFKPQATDGLLLPPFILRGKCKQMKNSSETLPELWRNFS